MVLNAMTFQVMANAPTLSQQIENIYQRSLMAAGRPEQMDKRALTLYHLYLDSDKEFTFALSVSHLTLAIDRSSNAPRFTNILDLMQMKKTALGWTKWGDGLKQINQQMVQRLHFAYYVYKEIITRGYSLDELMFSQKNNKAFAFLLDTQELYPLFEEIAKKENDLMGKKQIAFHFARWEHERIIQPRIMDLYDEMPGLIQFMVRHVPDTGIEFFLKALQIRTTLGLECLSPFTPLRTKDFMDSQQRVNQAVNFHSLLAKNNFDPEHSCFNDPYYTINFPKRFHQDPESFTKWYYQFITKQDFSNTEEAWLHASYKNLPVVEMATLPSLKIPIMPFYKDQLQMESDPLVRNSYINEHYQYLGKHLMQCFGFDEKEPFANWYHYAYWASKSARKVISGDFFLNQDIAIKIGMNFASFFGLFQKPTMQGIFARTNNLIALEMIPLGQEFFHTFCQEGETDFNKFAEKLLNDQQQDQILVFAFYQYYMAIHEKDLKTKKERIAYATTLQVMSEQMRVDDNIKEAFRYNGSIPLAEYVFHQMATHSGALDLGIYQMNKDQRQIPLRSGRISSGRYSRDINEIFNGNQMHLEYDVRTAQTDRDLLDIKLAPYQNLLAKYKLENNIRRIHKYKKTGVDNWAKLHKRLKHLIAQFRTNMTNPKVFNMEDAKR